MKKLLLIVLLIVGCEEPTEPEAKSTDCAGVSDGSAVEDCFDICDGTAVIDCAGVCGGSADDCPAPNLFHFN
jgi:hypothetical protein